MDNKNKLQFFVSNRPFKEVTSTDDKSLYCKYFSDDINKLEKFLQIDLDSWKR